jgi:hypothetical protein
MAQTLSLDLDEQTVAQARAAASARGQTLEAVVADAVRQLVRGDELVAGVGGGTADRVLGMFADTPALLDEVVVSAMAARERDPLRSAS